MTEEKRPQISERMAEWYRSVGRHDLVELCDIVRVPLIASTIKS